MATEENNSLFDGVNFDDSFEIDDSGIMGGLPIVEQPSNITQDNKRTPDDVLQDELKDLIEIDDNVEEGGETKVTGTDEKRPLSQENNNADSSSPYKTFAKFLHEEGVFSSSVDELEIEDASSLKDLLESEVDTRIDSFINSLSGKKRAVVEAALDPDVSEETLISILSNAKSQVDLMKYTEEALESDTDAQKAITREFLKAKDFSDKEIDEQIDDWDSLGKLEEKSKQALRHVLKSKEEEGKKLIENDKQKKVIQEQQRIESLQRLKEKVTATTEIIPGISINKNLQDKIYNSMITPVDKTENGVPITEIGVARLKDPVAFDMKVNYIFQLTKGFSDWSKLVESSKSNAIKDLDAVIKSNTSYKPGVAPQTAKKVDATDLFASLKDFKR